jgi:hypothetical protein
MEERVPSLTLKQIMEMQDQPVSSTTDQLAREFLEVFEPGKPLDKEGFEDWIQLHSIKMTDIKRLSPEPLAWGGWRIPQRDFG